MLKEIKTSDLKIGTRYSAPLFFDDGKNMFLPQGLAISNYEISVIKNWNIFTLLTEGKEISIKDYTNNIEELEDLEDLEELEDFDDLNENQTEIDLENSENIALNGTKITKKELANILPKNINKITETNKVLKLHKLYNEIIPNIGSLFKKINNKEKIDNNEIKNYIKVIRSLIKKAPSLCMSFILDTAIEENDLARSSINTTILAIILSSELKLEDSKIDEVATVALLHDIGMMKVPDAILNKNGTLSDEEKKTVSNHTLEGYKLALNDLSYPEDITLGIMQHHEKWDGTGVPTGLAKEQIILTARIVSVADAFVAMTTPKPYRDLMLGYQAMKNLLSDNARRFDPVIIRVMIKSIGIYPIGSIVLMNNASLARVIKSSPNAPMRPYIKILIDETGTVFDETSEIIDLKLNKSLFIVRAIDPRVYKNK